MSQARREAAAQLLAVVHKAVVQRLDDEIDDVRAIAADILLIGASGQPPVRSRSLALAAWKSLVTSDWLASCSQFLLPLFAKLLPCARLVDLAGACQQMKTERSVHALKSVLGVLSPYCFHVTIAVRRAGLRAITALVLAHWHSVCGRSIEATATGDVPMLHSCLLRFTAQQRVLETDEVGLATLRELFQFLVAPSVCTPAAVALACQDWMGSLLALATPPAVAQPHSAVVDATGLVGAVHGGSGAWDETATAATAFKSVPHSASLQLRAVNAAVELSLQWDLGSQEVGGAALRNTVVSSQPATGARCFSGSKYGK